MRRCVAHLPILKQLTIAPEVVDAFTEKVDVIVVNFQDYLYLLPTGAFLVIWSMCPGATRPMDDDSHDNGHSGMRHNTAGFSLCYSIARKTTSKPSAAARSGMGRILLSSSCWRLP